MTAATTDTQVREYLAAVERFLDDLPDHERRDLLEDLEEHLSEVAAEDEGSLVDRLGPPDAYAAELRASAGLPEYVATAEISASERLRRSLRTSPLGALASSAPVQALRGYRPELRPTWWVVRGYLAAVVRDAMFFGRDATDGGLPWPRVAESPVVGTLLVAACVWVSILAGRATRDRERYAMVAVAANIAIVLTFLGAFPRGEIKPDAVNLVQAEPFGFLQHGDGAAITNICAYDEAGTRVNGIELFDQDGRPIVESSRGKLRIEMDRGDGLVKVFPPDPRGIDPEAGVAGAFECPKKLKDLQSKRSPIERGMIRKNLLRDDLVTKDLLPEKLRPFVEE
jgi:hypothetical protein